MPTLSSLGLISITRLDVISFCLLEDLFSIFPVSCEASHLFVSPQFLDYQLYQTIKDFAYSLPFAIQILYACPDLKMSPVKTDWILSTDLRKCLNFLDLWLFSSLCFTVSKSFCCVLKMQFKQKYPPCSHRYINL